jgi:two-component system, OmpR family, alkaline phosphatase synthesis response regulator PhoP
MMKNDGKKILVVEDEAHLAKGLQFNLEREGYRVTLADNGESALELLGKEAFDLMILDIMLPKLSGLEVARKIRNRDLRFPILMLSAKSTDEDRETGLEAGADDYLTVSLARTLAEGERHSAPRGMVQGTCARSGNFSVW